MEGLDLQQMATMVKVIAEEKDLPEETVLEVVEMAIAAAWRRDNGDRDMDVRAVLNTKTGEATVIVSREVVEDGLAYNRRPRFQNRKLRARKLAILLKKSIKLLRLAA